MVQLTTYGSAAGNNLGPLLSGRAASSQNSLAETGRHERRKEEDDHGPREPLKECPDPRHGGTMQSFWEFGILRESRSKKEETVDDLRKSIQRIDPDVATKIEGPKSG